VLLARLTDDLDRLPADLVVGPVAAKIEQVVGGSLAQGGEGALATLRSERYIVLLERLVDAAWEPMSAPIAEQPTRRVIPRLIESTWQRLARDVRRLGVDGADDHDWHQARIDAKQLRYACEAVHPAFGKPAKQLAKRAEAVQEILGEHQDAVIAGARLRAMATAPRSGNVAFTLGLLHARQQEAAALARTQFRDAWAEASRSRYRRWLAT
jgi:CHAD domain-containing protein